MHGSQTGGGYESSRIKAGAAGANFRRCRRFEQPMATRTDDNAVMSDAFARPEL